MLGCASRMCRRSWVLQTIAATVRGSGARRGAPLCLISIISPVADGLVSPPAHTHGVFVWLELYRVFLHSTEMSVFLFKGGREEMVFTPHLTGVPPCPHTLSRPTITLLFTVPLCCPAPFQAGSVVPTPRMSFCSPQLHFWCAGLHHLREKAREAALVAEGCGWRIIPSSLPGLSV